MSGSLRLVLVASLPVLASFGCSAQVAEQPEHALLIAHHPDHSDHSDHSDHASPGAPPDLVESGAYAYRYYADVEAYYADDRGLWFWPGASYWGVGRHLPSTYEPQVAARNIRLETDRPYRLHGLVRSVYPPPPADAGLVATADEQME